MASTRTSFGTSVHLRIEDVLEFDRSLGRFAEGSARTARVVSLIVAPLMSGSTGSHPAGCHG